LEPFIWTKYKSVVGDAFAGFESFIDLGIELHLPIVLLGDIFDTVKPSPMVMRFFRKQMDRCVAENIPVFAIQGNHDKQPVPWYVACHDGVRHIGDGTPVHINGVDCVGFDYALRETIEEQVAELAQLERRPQCLMMHQAAKQALRFEGKWNVDLELVPSDIPLILMADIHTPWHAKIRDGQNAYYTGPSSPREIGQIGPKSCILVNTDLSSERLPITYRQILRVNATAPDQLSAAEAWLADLPGGQILPPLLWLLHTPECLERVVQLKASVADKDIIVVSETVASVAEMQLQLDGEEKEREALLSVPDLLNQLVDPEVDERLHTFILALLDSGNSILDVLRDFRARFIAEQGEQ